MDFLNDFFPFIYVWHGPQTLLKWERFTSPPKVCWFSGWFSGPHAVFFRFEDIGMAYPDAFRAQIVWRIWSYIFWLETFDSKLSVRCYFSRWTVKQPQRLKRVAVNQFFPRISRPFDLVFFSALSFKTLWRKTNPRRCWYLFSRCWYLFSARKCFKWMKCRNLEVAHSLQGRNAETRANSAHWCWQNPRYFFQDRRNHSPHLVQEIPDT